MKYIDPTIQMIDTPTGMTEINPSMGFLKTIMRIMAARRTEMMVDSIWLSVMEPMTAYIADELPVTIAVALP